MSFKANKRRVLSITQDKRIYNEQPLTGNNIRSNLRIALCEGVENPAAARIEALMRQVVEIRQRAETVDPEPEPLKLGPVEAGVRLHPAGRGEAQDHKDEHEEAHTQRPFPGCCSFPVQLCIREDVVFQAHLGFFSQQVWDCGWGTTTSRLWGEYHSRWWDYHSRCGWDYHKQVMGETTAGGGTTTAGCEETTTAGCGETTHKKVMRRLPQQQVVGLLQAGCEETTTAGGGTTTSRF